MSHQYHSLAIDYFIDEDGHVCVWVPMGREEDGAAVYLGSDADPVI